MPTRWVKAVILAITVCLLAPATSSAGDAFFKLGITFDPDLGSFSNKWFLSAGSDWGFRPQAFWGLEFQGAYRSDEVGSFKTTQVPANVFLNFKWKADQEQFRPYAGGGFGLISSYVKVEAFGEDNSEWVKDAGFQLMGGVEFNRKFVVELMGQRPFDDGAVWLWSILFGLRF